MTALRAAFAAWRSMALDAEGLVDGLEDGAGGVVVVLVILGCGS